MDSERVRGLVTSYSPSGVRLRAVAAVLPALGRSAAGPLGPRTRLSARPLSPESDEAARIARGEIGGSPDGTHLWPPSPTAPGQLPPGAPNRLGAAPGDEARQEPAILVGTAESPWPSPHRAGARRGSENAAPPLLPGVC